MSVSGTPVPTYDDGFPKAHPSLPPSPRRSGRAVVQRRTRVESRRSRPTSSQRVVGRLGARNRFRTHTRASPLESSIRPRAPRRGRAGWVGPWETRRRTSGQADRQPTGGRSARQSDRVSQRPPRPTRPVDRRRLGRHSFELRHYADAGLLAGAGEACEDRSMWWRGGSSVWLILVVLLGLAPASPAADQRASARADLIAAIR